MSFKAGLSRTESVLTIVLATLLLAVIFGLVVSDDRAMSAYGKRIAAFENSTGAPPPTGAWRRVSPVKPTHLLIFGVLAFNIAVIARLAFWPAGL